jgi:hypothetical protein
MEIIPVLVNVDNMNSKLLNPLNLFVKIVIPDVEIVL